MPKVFPAGLIYKLPRENAPDFVKGSLSIKVDEFVNFLHEHQNNGWVNLDFLKSKDDKLYFALNEWKKQENKEQVEPQEEPQNNEEESFDNVPF